MIIDNPIVTGSLVVQNNVSASNLQLTGTGSGVFSGSFLGDGSQLSGVTSYTDTDTESFIKSIGVLSGSAQIASDISGSFTSLSSSLEQRVTSQESFSSSLDATFATDAELSSVSESLAASIAGISTDFTDITNKPALISSSAQFTDLTAPFTGSFTGSFFGDGSNLSGVTSYTDSDTLSFIQGYSGSYSGSFVGDGSQLSGVTSYTDSDTLDFINSISVLSGSIAELTAVTASFFNTGSVTIPHSFNSKNVSVAVYDDSDILIIPQEIVLISNNAVKITFGGSTSGFAVVAKGGHIVLGSVPVPQLSTVTDSFTSATTHTVTHNFNTKEVIVSVYEGDTFIIPDSITTNDVNNVTVTFPEAVTGRVVVVKAGHIVSGSIPFDNLLSSPFEQGTLAVTSSKHIVPSQDQTYDLGSSTLRFRDLYLSSASIFLGNTVISEDNVVTTSSLASVLPDNVVSSSVQIGSDISGSFTSVSASLASDISLNVGSITSLNSASSSYLLNTTDTLDGDLTVTGKITAQEFHTEFVSASIIFQSGSTKFGDSSDDVHSITGSLSITGNVSTIGTLTASGYNSANWDTAFGYGNHASAGYLTSISEATSTVRGGIELFNDTDQSVAANTITATAGRTYGIQLNSAGQAVVNVPWVDTNTTYSVGNGGLTEINFTSTLNTKLAGIATGATNVTNTNQLTNGAGFLTSLGTALVDADFSSNGLMKRTGAGTYAIVTDNSSNWNTAYGWGNHASLYMTQGQTRTDINTITNGGNRYEPSINNPTNEHYAVLTYGNSSNVTGQLATHFQTGNLYSRGYNSSWSAWRKYWNSTDFSSTNISNWNTAYGWGNHASAGYLTSVTNISGYSGELIRTDNRIISPNELGSGRMSFGFTSWNNNNGSPYADFIHLRSYTDGSGGNDNLVTFLKSGIGMRIWQQSYGSATPYSSYVDVLSSGATHQIKSGILQSNSSLRAPIFYDSANTAYYFDGSSTGDSIRVAGDIVAYYSDERLKDKKGNIQNAIEKVKKLNGFYYTPNKEAQRLGYKNTEQVGVSAQEVEAVLPQIIKDAPIGNGYKTLDYSKLVPLLIEAIKEQQQQIDELKSLLNK